MMKLAVMKMKEKMKSKPMKIQLTKKLKPMKIQMTMKMLKPKKMLQMTIKLMKMKPRTRGHISILNNNDEESQLKTQSPKQKDKKTKISSEHVEVMKAIEGINSVLKQVLENQNKLMNLWEASGILKSMPQAFHEKYKLNIPFKTIEEFINFN